MDPTTSTDDLQPAKQVCPACGNTCDPETRICMRCGTDLITGQKHQSVVHQADGQPENDPDRCDTPEPDPGIFRILLALVGAYFPGLFKAYVLILSMIVGALGLTLIGWALFMVIALGFGGVFIGTASGAIGMVLYAQAVAWMVGGRLEMLPDLLTEFVSGQWGIFMLLFGIPFPLFYFLMLAIKAAGP